MLRLSRVGIRSISRTPLLGFQFTRLQSTLANTSTTNKQSASLTTEIEQDESTYPDVEKDLYYYRNPDSPWDDKQNRRNIGQTLNIDDDEVNLWSPHYYDNVSDGTALRWQFYFFASIGAFSGIVYYFFYPERVAVPRNYPDGLAKDLGSRNDEDAHLYRVGIDKTFYEKS